MYTDGLKVTEEAVLGWMRFLFPASQFFFSLFFHTFFTTFIFGEFNRIAHGQCDASDRLAVHDFVLFMEFRFLLVKIDESVRIFVVECFAR